MCVESSVECAWFLRLKLRYRILVSSFAFNFNLRRYTMVLAVMLRHITRNATGLSGRGLHSSTLHLYVSTFCG